jgi:hypothetical protein
VNEKFLCYFSVGTTDGNRAVEDVAAVQVLDVARPTGQLEMIRTALAIGVGTGAIMTLVLAWRRQMALQRADLTNCDSSGEGLRRVHGPGRMRE